MSCYFPFFFTVVNKISYLHGDHFALIFDQREAVFLTLHKPKALKVGTHYTLIGLVFAFAKLLQNPAFQTTTITDIEILEEP